MNSYYLIVGEVDGSIQEFFIWAGSLKIAESLLIYNIVPLYLKQNRKKPTNTYRKIERVRSTEKSEFVISIQHTLDESAFFFVTARKCEGINLNSYQIIYS